MNEKEVRRGIGKVLFPEVDPGKKIRAIEFHLVLSDQLLEAVLDTATIGMEEANVVSDIEASHRFGRILELVDMYRAGIEALTETIYPPEKLPKPRNAKAA